MKKLILILIITFGIFIFPSTIKAATILFNEPIYEVGVGEEIVIPIKLDTEGLSINTITGKIILEGDLALIDSINEKESFILLWIERPTYSENKIEFSGIIPGGFSGVLGVGVGVYDPGTILNVVVKGKIVGEVILSVLVDTLIEHSKNQRNIPVLAKTLKINIVEKNVYEKIAPSDNEPPEVFNPVIVKSDFISSTGYGLVFQTRDADSGVDHYEIKIGNSEFFKADSPYALDKSNIHSIMYVRAIDRNGNERIVKVVSSDRSGQFTNIYYITIFVAMLFTFFIYKEWRRKLNQEY